MGGAFNPQGGSNDENYDIVLNESMMMDDNGATFAGRIGITTLWCISAHLSSAVKATAATQNS